MHIKSLALAVAAAVFALLAAVGVASAAPAQLASTVNVRYTPQVAPGNVVDVLPRYTIVNVTHCNNPQSWCHINSPVSGWVSAQFLVAVGNNPPPIPGPFPPPFPGPGPGPGPGYPCNPNFSLQFGTGQSPSFSFGCGPGGGGGNFERVCFYSGSGYDGSSFCVGPNVRRNTMPSGWNDRVSSIRVFNGGSVRICGQTNLNGVCQNVTSNRAQLGPILNNNVSSFRTY